MIPGSRTGLFGAPQRYRPYGVKFDGTNDYVSRGAALTGVSDSKTIIVSGWFRLDSFTNPYILYTSNSRFFFDFAAGSNGIRVAGYNSSGTLVFAGGSSIGFSASSTAWRHIAFTIDMDTIGNCKMYIDGVGNYFSVSTYTAGQTISFASGVTNWFVGSDNTGTNRCSFGMADMYVAPGQYIDLAANISKFYSATGNPIYLGATGTLPTGTQPAILLQNPAASWGTNSGSGGNLTITGALDSITGP